MGMTRWVTLLAGATLFGLDGSGSDLEAQERKPKQPDPLAGLDAQIEKVRTSWAIPGLAVGIVKDDSLVYGKGFGVREVGKPEPVDQHTVFAIGSNTKSFTATAAAMLVDDGQLKWNDRAAQLYSGFQLFDPYVTREITVRDLLSHRAGLGRRGDALWYGTSYSRDEIIRRIRYLEPNAGFRTEMGYQNVMYLTAGEIVGKTSGLGWDEFITQRILKPLGMTRSGTSIRDLPAQSNVSTPHAIEAGYAKVIPWRNIDNIGPAGSINSSVAEMANYLRFQLGDGTFRGTKLVSKATLAVTKTPHINVGGAGDSLTHFTSYGLGWVLLDYRGKKIAWHNGGIDGMLSEMWTVPEAGLGVVVLSNGSPHGAGPAVVWDVIDRFLVGAPTKDWNAEGLKQYQQIAAAQAAAEKRRDSTRVKGTQPPLPLPRYAGTYTDRLYGDLTLALEGDRLVLRWASFRVPLEHWHYGTFRGTEEAGPIGRAMVTFHLNASGEPARLELENVATFEIRRPPRG
jgi:CubicO group peptidase (beta-lactamase class C family)